MAPSSLSASAVSARQINLTWQDNSSNEAGFIIQCAPSSGGPWMQIASAGANATSYSNTGLRAATTYYYRVCDYNSRGSSSYSSAASATTLAAPCTYSISPTNASFTSSGGSGSVGVTAGAGCAWTATSSATWVTITAGGSGSGNGAVSYSVAANTSTTGRSGTLTIAGYTFTVNQSGAPCAYSLSTTTASFGASGGSGSVNVTANSTTCPWSATTTFSWITVTSGSAGSGNGTVNYTVAGNTSTTPRNGTLTIAGQTFTVSQAAAVPVVDTTPPTATLTAPASGSTVSGTVNLAADASDDVAVTKVEFYCNSSVLLGTATAAPWSAPCNTTTLSNGNHSFYCKAYDAATNFAISAASSVTVSNTTTTAGQLQWVKTIVSGYRLLPAGVATDHANNVAAVGTFEDAVGAWSDFGGAPMPSAAGWTGFIVKYTAQNSFVWAK